MGEEANLHGGFSNCPALATHTRCRCLCYPNGAVVRDRGSEQVGNYPMIADAIWGIPVWAAAGAAVLVRACVIGGREHRSALQC
jgi:hypothetical protein